MSKGSEAIGRSRREFIGGFTAAALSLTAAETSLGAAAGCDLRKATLTRVGSDLQIGDYAEVQGVRAGRFQPSIWEAGTLHCLFDRRAPVIAPAPGRYRNIYAPTLISEKGGFRVYYGGWDGVPTPNDRVYTQWTRDFRAFEGRELIIDHGGFIHVNNCSAVRLPTGDFRMMCTAYPDQHGLNKPAAFTSPAGRVWDGSSPYQPKLSDLIEIKGYPFANADINGTNAILYEKGWYRLYFADGHNVGAIFRASSRDFKTFSLDGHALTTTHVGVNDVKKFIVNGRKWYVMALHQNTDRLWYSLSNDGREFGAVREITANQSQADHFIVAVGWVSDAHSIYGFLYGAGPVPTLDQNQIFAKWLQKRVVFESASGTIEPEAAIGPNSALLPVSSADGIDGRFAVYAEDGNTLLYHGEKVRVHRGEVWRFQVS